jgi:hypothetical protein
VTKTDLIGIERGAEVGPGVWEYTVPFLGLCGKSRQPLLGGCRQIKSILGRCDHRREVGAAYTVLESSKVGKVKFAKYQPFDVAIRSLSREVVEEVV